MLALFVSAAGILVFLAWVFDWPWLKAPIAHAPAMQAHTAVAFTAIGAAVFLIGRRGWAPTLAICLAGIAGLLGGLSLVQSLFDVNLGVEQLWLPFITVPNAPGRMPPQSAAIFLLLASALLFSSRTRHEDRLMVGAASAICFAVATSSLLHYAHWLEHQDQQMLLLSAAPHAVLLQLLLGIATALLHAAQVRQRRMSGSQSLLHAAAWVVAVALVAAWAFVAWQDSNHLKKEATQSTANLARVLEEHMHRALDPVEVGLQLFARDVARRSLDAVTTSPEEWEDMRSRATLLPQVNSIIVLNASGDVAMCS